MRNRVLCSLILAGGSAGISAQPVAQGNANYVVVNTSPPGVLLVDPDRVTAVATIPIEEGPGPVVLSPSGDTLYAVHSDYSRSAVVYGLSTLLMAIPALGQRQGVGTLSIVDLKTRRVQKTVALSWNIAELSLSEDGRRLIALGAGRNDVKKPKPGELPAVHVLDPQTGEGATILMGLVVQQYVVTRDRTRIFGLAAEKVQRFYTHGRAPKDGSFVLKIADWNKSQPVVEIPLPGHISEMVLSKDEQWLYLIDPGRPDSNPKHRSEGKVHVVDARTGALVGAHSVGIYPRFVELDRGSDELRVVSHAGFKDHAGKLFRIRGVDLLGVTDLGKDPLLLKAVDGLREPLLVTPKEVCLVAENGQPKQPCLGVRALSVTKIQGANAPGFTETRIMEITRVPGRPALMLRTGQDGERLAFADWTGAGVTKVLTIGRPGSRAAKKSGHIALWTGITLIFAMGGRLPDFQPVPEHWTGVPPVMRPDGRYVYVANTYTADVAAIDTEGQSVASYFPLGGQARGLFLAPDGKMLCAFSQNRLVVIDTGANRVALQADLPGNIRQVTAPPGSSRILAVTDHEMAVWSTATWKLMGVLQGLNKPVLILPNTAK